MNDFFLGFNSWVVGVGEEYGVNPYLFIVLYFGLAPLFYGLVGWGIHNYRRSKAVIPYFSMASIIYFLPYIYLFSMGNELPIWVYALAVTLIILGGIISFKKIRKMARAQKEMEIEEHLIKHYSNI